MTRVSGELWIQKGSLGRTDFVNLRFLTTNSGIKLYETSKKCFYLAFFHKKYRIEYIC